MTHINWAAGKMNQKYKFVENAKKNVKFNKSPCINKQR